MRNTRAEDLGAIPIDLKQPTIVFREGPHSIYWLGITDETAFRCNSFLVADGEQAIIFDPGSRVFFEQVRNRVAQVIPPECVSGMVISHQDPDIAASMPDWLELNPDMWVFTSPRANVLLPHYGREDYRYYDISERPDFVFSSGAMLRFIESPFLHFAGAFTTYDTSARYLFSSDIWAALDMNWSLTVEDFTAHAASMDLFHMDYMASNLAARGYARRIEDLAIDAILPQHGSIITRADVPAALEYLRNLRCGTDIAYADLEEPDDVGPHT